MSINFICKVDEYGTKYWYLNDKLHREDGPAVEYADGSKRWYLNDQLHRVGGPAIERANGGKCWYLNDNLHRVDGPAIEFANGYKAWYVDGERINVTTNEAFLKLMSHKQSEKTTMNNDQPISETDEYGVKRWYLNGKLHREDGPAVEWPNGDKFWYLNGKCHREDGPAIERANGDKFWYLNGKLHRVDGPSIEYADGYKEWYVDGKQINVTTNEAFLKLMSSKQSEKTTMNNDQPICKTDEYGVKRWYLNGKLHREDGPAVEWPNGAKSWWLNGKLHREDGPAAENANGIKEWFLNGKQHRVDGPAIECTDGTKYWYVDGERINVTTNEEFLKLMSPKQSEKTTMNNDQPISETDEYGNKYWYLNGKLHRVDGPAIELADGDKYWYLNDKRHREDGPAIERANGDKFWYLNGKQHREDGPAIEYADGTKYWYVDGERINVTTNEAFLKLMSHKQSDKTTRSKEELLKLRNEIDVELQQLNRQEALQKSLDNIGVLVDVIREDPSALCGLAREQCTVSQTKYGPCRTFIKSVKYDQHDTYSTSDHIELTLDIRVP